MEHKTEYHEIRADMEALYKAADDIWWKYAVYQYRPHIRASMEKVHVWDTIVELKQAIRSALDKLDYKLDENGNKIYHRRI